MKNKFNGFNDHLGKPVSSTENMAYSSMAHLHTLNMKWTIFIWTEKQFYLLPLNADIHCPVRRDPNHDVYFIIFN